VESEDWMHVAQYREQWRSYCEQDNEPLGSIRGE